MSNNCIDCKKLIYKRSIRCNPCNIIFRYKTDDVAKKISKTLTGKIYKKRFNHCNVIITCKTCKKQKEVPYNFRFQTFCSLHCSNVSRGRNSVLKQNRRSKNEVLFAKLCTNKFKNVKVNEPIFNGWDADIILPDYKVAVLWNGNWHHIKITKKHSLKQVQSRDKIKIYEIKNCGYFPYIINDYGRENSQFVDSEFKKLLNYLNFPSLADLERAQSL